MRPFDTAGPVKPDKHYWPLERIDLDEVLALVRDEHYFVLHAPRQTGKTEGALQGVWDFASPAFAPLAEFPHQLVLPAGGRRQASP